MSSGVCAAKPAWPPSVCSTLQWPPRTSRPPTPRPVPGPHDGEGLLVLGTDHRPRHRAHVDQIVALQQGHRHALRGEIVHQVHVLQAQRAGGLVCRDRPWIVGHLDRLAIDDAPGGGHDGARRTSSPVSARYCFARRDQRIVFGHAVAPDAVGRATACRAHGSATPKRTLVPPRSTSKVGALLGWLM